MNGLVEEVLLLSKAELQRRAPRSLSFWRPTFRPLWVIRSRSSR